MSAKGVTRDLISDIRIAARTIRASSWPMDMAHEMDRRAERILSWCDGESDLIATLQHEAHAAGERYRRVDAALRELHRPLKFGESMWCSECGTCWPCRTIEILEEDA